MTFKQLFDDDAVANSLESLAGTLKAAKKKKFVDYGPELLLQVSQLEWAVGEDIIIEGNFLPSKYIHIMQGFAFQGASDDVVITLKQIP